MAKDMYHQLNSNVLPRKVFLLIFCLILLFFIIEFGRLLHRTHFISYRLSYGFHNYPNHRLKGYQRNSLVSFTDGIFWSSEAERLLPSGFSVHDDLAWRNLVDTSSALAASAGLCGRMQNRQLVLSGGIKSCVRYRINQDQIMGEIYTHVLARALGIGNTPPTCLMTLNFSDWRYADLRAMLEAPETGWQEGNTVVLTKWIDGAMSASIPREFKQPFSHNSSEAKVNPNYLTLLSTSLTGTNLSSITDLIQWSDMIILDYITGNLDRYVNSLINVAWNDQIMMEPAHNLDRVKQSGLLLFIDNESGIFHGYRLLDRYQKHHSVSLRTNCVFKSSTVKALQSLPRNVGQLQHYLSSNAVKINPEVQNLPMFPKSIAVILVQRINHVLKHIEMCNRIYS